MDEIDRFVTRGKAVVPPTSRYKKKFSNLSREISSGKNRLLGRIRFFNKFRGFGIIDSEDKVCIFFPEDFRNSAGILDSNVLEGSSVSYVAIRSKKFEGGWRAEDVRVIKN